MLKAFKGGYGNEQWAVVPCGLYCRKYEYLCPAERLGELRQGDMSNWLLHLAGKTWVDAEALIEAFECALLVHKPEGYEKIDIKASVEAVREAKKRQLLFAQWQEEARPKRCHPSAGVRNWLGDWKQDQKDFNAWLKERHA